MKRRSHFFPAAALWLLPFFAPAQVPQSQTLQYVITDLGTFPGGTDSRAYGINDLGQVTGRATRADGSSRAFIYPDANGGLKDIGTNGSVGYSINNFGQIAASDGSVTGAYRYSGGVLSDLGQPLGGHCGNQSYGINYYGTVVGYAGRTLCGTIGAFSYSGSVVDLGGNGTQALAVNRAGWIAGVNASGNPYLFQPTPLDLGTLGGSGGTAYGINGAAQITGYARTASGANHAFVYDAPGGMRDLGALGGTASYGYGINAAGQVTGQFAVGGFGRAFVYTGGATYDLNDLVPDSALVAGIEESNIGNHINARGQIAAEGIVASGDRHALVLTPRGLGTQFSGGIGDLAGGNLSSGVLAVANGGTVAAGRGTNTKGPDATTWTLLGEMIGPDFNASGAVPNSETSGLSADGLIAVGYRGVTGRAFRMNTTSNTSIDMKNLPGHSFGTAKAIAANGSFSTGWSGEADASFQHAVRWDGAGNVFDELLPITGGGKSAGLGISGDGSVVTGWSEFGATGAKQAFRWSDTDDSEQVSGLGFLAGDTASTGYAVSADGRTIVGRSENATGGSAFRWTQAGGMQDLGDLPGGPRDATARAVSADGEVIVGTGTTAGGPAAFVWDKTRGLRSLQLVLGGDYNRTKKYGEYGVDFSGWTLTSANAISPDATTIGGEGIDPLGNTQAWIAQINSRTYRFMSGETYSGFHTLHLGGFGTEAELLGGATTGDTGSFKTVTVAMKNTKTILPAPATGYFSDIATLSGTGTDTVVLQLSYDATLNGAPVLARFDGTTWTKAVEGNSTGTPAPFIGAFDGNVTLGRYGYDSVNRVAWAVVDREGSFAVTSGTQSTTTTLDATSVSNTTATLNGSVSPDNKTVTVAFEYGEDPTLANPSVAQVAGTFSGTAAQAVSASLTGLTNNHTYYFRARITVGALVIYGVPLSFTTQNQSPVARDDIFIIPSETQLAVLGNDTDADPTDTLSIQSVTAAHLGTATISNGATIFYSPGDLISGDGQGDSFTYTIKDSFDAQATATVHVYSTQQVAGTYSGLIGASDGNGTDSGRLDVTLTRTGALSGSFKWQGQLYSFKDGALQSDGSLTKSTPKIDGAGAVLTFRLQLDPVTKVLTGTLTDDSTIPATVAHAEVTGTALLEAADLPTPGLYSAYIDPGTVSAAPAEAGAALVLPRGLGFSQITVAGKQTSRSRPARVVGRMPDDQPFSSGARALIKALRAAAGKVKYPLYVDNLYPKVRNASGRMTSGGVVSGDLGFTQGSDSRFDSALNWERLPNTRAARFGGGIRGLVAALNAVKYGKPPPGNLPAGIIQNGSVFNAKIELREGDLANPIVHPLRISRAGNLPATVLVEPQNRALNTQKLRLSINVSTGTFSGKFVHPHDATAAKPPMTSFRGVFKKQDGRGAFTGPTNTGRVVILPQ